MRITQKKYKNKIDIYVRYIFNFQFSCTNSSMPIYREVQCSEILPITFKCFVNN